MDDFKITPIRNGTVIDHITAGQAINVLKILNVNENTISSTISVAMHVKSQKGYMWKDIIKIEDRELDPKTLVEDRVFGLARCSNPDCITNKGEPVETEFIVTSRDPPALRCAYCDRMLINISDNLI